VPPYTDEDAYDDEDETGIDNHDDKDNSDETIDPNMPSKCYGLALSDSYSLGPYQAGVVRGLIKELRATSEGEY